MITRIRLFALAPPLALFGSQSPLAVIEGDLPDDSLGAAVASVGDLDGDGYSEFALGAPGKESASSQTPGQVQLYSGADASLLGTAFGVLGGTQFGAALAPISDLNGDGVGDLIVGAPADAGRVVALDGARLVAGDATELWANEGRGLGALGQSLAPLGDCNGDGVPDVAAGEPFYNVLQPTTGPGRVLMISGADGTTLGTIDGPPDDLASFGWSLVAVRDLDDDGCLDLAVGAPTSDGLGSMAGAVYFVSTRSGAILMEVPGERDDGQLGLALTGGMARAGNAPATVYAGEPGATVGAEEPGRVLWLSPRSSAPVRAWTGVHPGGGFGSALALDVASGQLAIGEPWAADLGPVHGAVHLLDVQSRALESVAQGPGVDSAFGSSVDFVPGADGAKLLVGAPGYDVQLNGDEGRAELYETDL